MQICTQRGQRSTLVVPPLLFSPSLRQGLTSPGAHGFGKANWSPLPSAPALGDNPVPLHPGGAGDLNPSPHASQGGTLLLSSPASSR